MLIKEHSKVSGFGGGGEGGAAEVDRDGGKRTQILSGTESEKLEFREVNFETVTVKMVA